MQRSTYKAIDRYYNQGTQFNVPMPIFRRAVMPGQTANLDGTVHYRTPALPVSLAKLVVTASYFYVPYRIIYDGWVDYITDGTGTFPTGAQSAVLWDNAATNSAMMRRAYKLVYNEYFSDENSASGLYDVDLDTFVTFDKPVLALEQRLREVLPASQFTDDEYVAPVVGADATINHSDFSRSASNARRDFNFEKSGDKYVDYLRQFGVNARSDAIDKPEHLGSVTRDVMPRQAAASDGANLGALRSYYSVDMPHRFRSKRFSEHGIVIGIAYARPVVFNFAFDALDVNMINRDTFFNGDNVNIKSNWSALVNGTSEDVVVPPAYRYSAGQHVGNNNGNADMILTINSPPLNRRYGVIVSPPSEPTLGTDSFCYLNDVTWSGASPASTALVF